MVCSDYIYVPKYLCISWLNWVVQFSHTRTYFCFPLRLTLTLGVDWCCDSMKLGERFEPASHLGLLSIRLQSFQLQYAGSLAPRISRVRLLLMWSFSNPPKYLPHADLMYPSLMCILIFFITNDFTHADLVNADFPQTKERKNQGPVAIKFSIIWC